MSNAFVIEPLGIPAGIAVREQNRFRFIATDQRFRLLDGSLFRDPVAAESSARRLLRASEPEPGRRFR